MSMYKNPNIPPVYKFILGFFGAILGLVVAALVLGLVKGKL